jgi:apolipoprotein N-acyltransferase
VLNQVPIFVRGTASAQVQPRTGATPFVRFGNWPALLLALGLVGAGLLIGRRGAV